MLISFLVFLFTFFEKCAIIRHILNEIKKGRVYMRCPACGFADSKVIDSRPASEGNSIRRRRECLSCQKRFNTFETIETTPIIVIKKSGGKELFDKQKFLQIIPFAGIFILHLQKSMHMKDFGVF